VINKFGAKRHTLIWTDLSHRRCRRAGQEMTTRTRRGTPSVSWPFDAGHQSRAQLDIPDQFAERILDFDALEEKNYEGSEQLEEYDPSTGPTVWIIKYLVKWKDYESPE
jgi:hypothetical protein